ncbi:MAG: formylglycine-generating enzyme family protein [Spirochaetaceae bacterium]|nr:formylglycine-generating enzyme family protein [Spirochaetaceae bacterium]
MRNPVVFFAAAALLLLLLSGCPDPSSGDDSDSAEGDTLVEMVQIPGGSFKMGSPETVEDSFDDERPVRTVTLSPFLMGKYEVSQEQYQAVMGSNPSYFDGSAGREAAEGEIQGRRPAENMNWYSLLVFCNTLSVREGFTPVYSINGSSNPADWGAVPTESTTAWNKVVMDMAAKGYRLPTEAEWEYAACDGVGIASGGFRYPGSDTLGDVAWYTFNSGGKTHEAGKKKPNAFGLYDMAGNVYEYCWDVWETTYPSEDETDPRGKPTTWTDRVYRGGNYNLSMTRLLRSATRSYGFEESAEKGAGFRLVRRP